ncbi:MAG: metalloregulator ArsR/SmtB family transcription factor [Oscillospiraceae bacterium]|nr:metalloregulator ArsR/SmtB family transcription factor [Oscillospiraceae bacterium]
MNVDIANFFKCFADQSRIDIINILSSGESYTELISDILSLTMATVSFHLKKLEAAGIVSSRREQYYLIYTLNNDLLDKKLSDIVITTKSERANSITESEYAKKVISTFFQHGKLNKIPAQLKKREIVLREILKAFELEREYTEREVNIIIADFNDDFCALRRAMIEFKLMERENMIYKRLE